MTRKILRQMKFYKDLNSHKAMKKARKNSYKSTTKSNRQSKANKKFPPLDPKDIKVKPRHWKRK